MRDPTRGAFFAGCRTGSHGAALSSVHQTLPAASSGNKGSSAARIARAFSMAFVALASDASAMPMNQGRSRESPELQPGNAPPSSTGYE